MTLARACVESGARAGGRDEAKRKKRSAKEWWKKKRRLFFPPVHQPTLLPLLPSHRGKFRSKPWDAVVAEAASLVADGAVELCLVAEDTNQYGLDRPHDGTDLAHLLRELSAIDGLKWIRLLYCYPSYFSDDLIDEIAANPKVCPYIDIPLQHVHNLTLLAMARPPRAHADALLAKLRARIPDLALRTTFICGFPGETDAAHRELVDYCAAFRFERMGAFAYSAEDGTPAATLPDQVEDGVRAARRDELIALQQEVGAAFAESLVGTEVDVLVDGYDDDGCLVGRTQWDAPDVDPVVFVGTPDAGSGVPPAQPGTMVRCVVTAASLFDLEATPVSGPL